MGFMSLTNQTVMYVKFCTKWFHNEKDPFESDVCFFLLNIIFLKCLFMLIYVDLSGLLILAAIEFFHCMNKFQFMFPY